jgi:hypothetical protein
MGEGEKEKHLFPTQKMEQRLKMVIPNSQFNTGELGKYTWSKIMGLADRVRSLSKSYPKSETIGCLGLLFPIHDYFSTHPRILITP